MAIDPKLVSIKTAGELSVSDPSENANFLFYEGDKLQTSPMSNIYDKVSSGLLPATTATVPEATGFHRYLVHEAGTYTNFSGIVVSAADLDIVAGVANNRVILDVNNGVATKRVERVKGDEGVVNYNAGQLIPTSVNKAETGKSVADYINVLTNGGTNISFVDYTQTIGFKLGTDGSLVASANIRYSSFIPVKKGEKWYFTLSMYTQNPLVVLYSAASFSSFVSVLAQSDTTASFHTVNRTVTIPQDGFIVVCSVKTADNPLAKMDLSRDVSAKIPLIEDTVLRDVKNYILDIKKHGFPQNFTWTSTPKYNPETEAFETTGNIIVKFPLDTIARNDAGEITARKKYVGFEIGVGQNVLNLRTQDDANAVISTAYIRKNIGATDLVYIDVSNLTATNVDFRMQAAGNKSIFNFFMTDTVPNAQILEFVIIDKTVGYKPFWWDATSRWDYSPQFSTGNIQSGSNRLTYVANFLKRYLFFRVKTSMPALTPQDFQVRILSSTNVSLKSVTAVYGEGFMLDLLGVNLDQALNIQLVSALVAGQAGSWRQIYDIRTSDSPAWEIAERYEGDIPEFTTSFEAKDLGINEFRIGDKIFSGTAPAKVDFTPDYDGAGMSDISMYDYTGKRISIKEVVKETFVDLKGTWTANYNAGRYLMTIDTDEGIMYFKNNLNIEKISVENFLASLVAHDKSDTDYNRLDYLELPTSATAQQKQDEFNKMALNWKMPNGSFSPSILTTGATTSTFNEIGQLFPNGNLFTQTLVVKPDGTTYNAKLKNPIVGNPTHLIISQGGSVLHEIPLRDQANALRWGELNANEGTHIYPSVFACINFTNGAEITINQALDAGAYTFALRGRYYGTTRIDGDVLIKNGSTTLGTISTVGTATTAGQLADRTQEVSLVSAITSLKLVVSCPTEKSLTLGNNASSIGVWGRTVEGRFGTIVEYSAAPQRREGKVYFTQDYGETWSDVFDCSLNQMFKSSNAYHLHGARYDKYWNRLMIVHGDNDSVQYGFWADITANTNINSITWNRLTKNKSLYKVNITEQHCSVFPMKDTIVYGTDMTITGLYRMFRTKKGEYTPTEPAHTISESAITHIPTAFFQKTDISEAFSLSMTGDTIGMDAAPRLYKSSLLHSSLDGITWKEVWKDKVKNTGFGFNASMNVFEYKGKIFLSIFHDNRFKNDHTLVILDYK